MQFTPVEIENICVQAIREYLNRPLSDEEIKDQYNSALLVMMKQTDELLISNNAGVASITQGSQSITYDNTVQAFKVNDMVKALLPKPYMKLL